jgi:hypothetical protein
MTHLPRIDMANKGIQQLIATDADGVERQEWLYGEIGAISD